jgi:hypothetical protein
VPPLHEYGVHVEAPVAANVPIEHVVHPPATPAARALPATHAVHSVRKALGSVPAGHMVHDCTGSVLPRAVPGAQSVHTAPVVARPWPPTQSVRPVPVRNVISLQNTH